MASESELRREICHIGRRVHDRGLVAGTDGNVSARLADDRLLITPSGSCLGMLQPEDLVLIDRSGRVPAGDVPPSSERWMHLEAYAQRPDVMGVIHAHPPSVVSFTLSDTPMPQRVLPEMILAFGQVPVAQYATPATEEGAAVIRELIRRHDALVLDRHGSLTVGKSVTDAFFKLEKLEHGAWVIFMAQQLGAVRDLPPEELSKLAALREALGLGRSEDVPTGPDAP